MKTIIFIIGVDCLGFPIACIHRKRDYIIDNIIGRGKPATIITSEIKTLY